jgi:hypothetical protein
MPPPLTVFTLHPADLVSACVGRSQGISIAEFLMMASKGLNRVDLVGEACDVATQRVAVFAVRRMRKE